MARLVLKPIVLPPGRLVGVAPSENFTPEPFTIDALPRSADSKYTAVMDEAVGPEFMNLNATWPPPASTRRRSTASCRCDVTPVVVGDAHERINQSAAAGSARIPEQRHEDKCRESAGEPHASLFISPVLAGITSKQYPYQSQYLHRNNGFSEDEVAVHRL